jgi:hypothetical protein
VSPMKDELGFYIPEDDILHSHRRENLKPYKICALSSCKHYLKYFVFSPVNAPQYILCNGRVRACFPVRLIFRDECRP